MNSVARSYLENESSSVKYEYPPNAALAKVKASSLRIRTEPSTESEEVMQVPMGNIVSILEEKEQDVEIGGNSGKWTFINFEGKEGWVFGAFLEKQ